MLIEGKICKLLPVSTGEGRNGRYEIHPYIIEWEEVEGGRAFTQSARVEFNVKTTQCAKLDALAGLPTTVKMSISHQVREYQGRYFNDLSCYIVDQEYRVQRSY